MLLTFENYGTHEGKPENGVGATLVGSGDIWQDGNNATYATIQYAGYENPWGHPYARIVELPLTREQADLITEVIVTWTARIVEHDPSAPAEYRSQASCSPIIRWGTGESDGAGPSYGSLATNAWYGRNEDSLAYAANPSAPWEEYYLPEDGSWKTMSERYAPIYAGGLTVQDILCNDFTNATFTRNSPEFGGTQDHLRLYAIIYQESYWSEEKFAVSEIQIELVGLEETPVIAGEARNVRRWFT